MDIAATILAGLTVLSVPFLWWLSSKARARREQEIADIKKFAEERFSSLQKRSQRLAELRPRLDALEEQGSWRELVASGEGAVEERSRLLAQHEAKILKVWARKQCSRELASSLYVLPTNVKVDYGHLPAVWQNATGRSVAIEECLAALETMRSEPVLMMYYRWLKESKADPEWLKDASLQDSTGIEDLHRKRGWRRGEQKPLAGLSY